MHTDQTASPAMFIIIMEQEVALPLYNYIIDYLDYVPGIGNG